MATQHCIAKTRDRRTGRTLRCEIRRRINPANGLCLWHDPERKGVADRARRRGGRMGVKRRAERLSPPPPVRTLDDAVRLASWIAHAVGTGELDARRGQVMVKAVETFTRSLEKRDLVNRVSELEAQLKRLRRAAREKTGYSGSLLRLLTPSRTRQVGLKPAHRALNEERGT